MSRNTWLARRAAMAIGLMVSFYVLALGVSFGLLWLAYLDVTRTRHPAWRLVAFCVLGAGSVLWAIVPRRDRFEAPGPRVTPEEQPELFAMIGDIARATSQAMPADVYLTNDVNAFVTQRDGFMGAGGRRVMGLGLPLMQALTVDEFKGVLTHEFGHYHAGDVALGPWIHKTQSAMGRTIVQLSENVLRYIFIGFGTLFLRVTYAVSRRQEFIADELAAQVAGPEAMASALRKVQVAAFAYQGYWYSEIVPVIQAGFRPPVIDGFRRYTSSPRVSALFDVVGREQEQPSDKPDPYDTHPSLADRLAALRTQPSRPATDARPATVLLRDVERCEGQLFAVLSADLADLKPVDWSRVGDAVYAPMWRARIKQHGTLLRDYTVAHPPATGQAIQTIAKGILPADGNDANENVAWQLIVAAFVLALGPAGWVAEALPGDEVVLRRGADELRPFSDVEALVAGRTSAAAWQERCAVLGIGAVPLGVEPVTMKDGVHG